MKKVIVASLMTVALSATADFDNRPWGNNGWNNNGNNANNGFIAHNPNSMFTPDWFSEEMDDMMDEFDSDDNRPWNNNRFNSSPWSNNGQWNAQNWRNNGPMGNNAAWQNRNWNQGPWGNSQPFNFQTNSFGPMNSTPWSNTNTPANTTEK